MSTSGLLDDGRVIALSYAKARFHSAFETLLELDATLGNAVRAARDPVLGQIRLAWWRDALESSARSATTADPVLSAIRALIARHDVIQGLCVAMVNGWEILLGDWPLNYEQLADFGTRRGGSLFAAAGVVSGNGPPDAIAVVGTAWALRDLALHCSDEGMAKRAMELANRSAVSGKLPSALRPFHILARFAELDAKTPPQNRHKIGAPQRIMQALGIVFLRR